LHNQGRIDSQDTVIHRVDRLTEALELDRHRIISVVGAGGKTSLMFAMARELATLGNHVITSTTTKIFEPSRKETPFLFVREGAADILNAIPNVIHRYGHLTLAESRLPDKKLRGVSPKLINGLEALDGVDNILVEADGAARLPLKAPDENEPVIPSKTSLVVVVVGIDSLGVELSADHVFRPRIASELTGVPLGGTVTAEAIAELIVHPGGMAKGTPYHSTIIPFLNKADIPGALEKGRELAQRILAKGHPKIKRVVLGNALSDRPVVEVLTRKIDS